MADFSQWWWQAAAADPGPGPGPGPDAGDPIGQSLRFRASSPNAGSCLSRSGFSNSGDVWTYSCWMKGWGPTDTTAQYNAVIFSWHNNTGLDTVDELAIFGNYPSTGRNEINFYFQGASAGLSYSNDDFNDPSAWYHVVWQSASTSGVKLFINGRQITNWRTTDGVTAQSFINKNQTCSIGGRAPASTSPQNLEYHGEGYLADAYFIDGQALDPTTFGRFNSQGVWVPVDAQGLTYGTNGFKLTFEDPSNIGKDYSGNGNDFTATGFDLAPPRIFSDGLWANPTATFTTDTSQLNKSFPSSYPPSNAFDGNDSTTCIANGVGGNWITWIGNLTNVNTLAVRTDSLQEIYVNGELATITPAAGSAQTTYTITNPPATITDISCHAQAAANARIYQIIVNGRVLVDNTGEDYDLMLDSPTQNWSTWNPLWRATGTPQAQWPAFERANLTAFGQGSGASGADANAQGTMLASGVRYVEMTLNNTSTGDMLFGLTGPEALVAGGGTRIIRITAAGAWDLRNNDNTSVATGNWSNGDIWGFLSDQDAGTCQVFLNGASLGIATGYQAEMEPGLTFQASSNGSFANKETTVNYGQTPWVHAPAGVTVETHAIQTQNLPTPAILDGREHFQAIVGSGQGADGTAVPGQRPGSWSAYLTTDGTWGSDGPGQAFTGQANGSTSAKVSPGSSANVTFEPPEFTFADKVEIWTNSNARVYFNGSPTPAVTGNNSFQEIASGGGTFRKIFYEHNTQAIHVNAIRVDGEILTDLNILSIAQSTFPDGLWWIKDRANSNQHQLVDSVTNAHQGGGNWAFDCPTYADIKNYVAPAGSSVAWCWNYNDVNPAENGFEIIIDNQATVSQVINHRLGVVPDMIISRGHKFTNGHWRVHFKEVGYSETLFLSTSGSAAVTDQRVTAASTTTFIYGNEAGAVGQDFTHYVFAAVPGYSAFGSYTGNNNVDGPAIVTGFRPAFVMYKCASTSGSWIIHDTTRDTANPTNIRLSANSTNSEGTSTSMDVDILSNGFKHRNSDPDLNANATYVYAAFAENPFQSPATAR